MPVVLGVAGALLGLALFASRQSASPARRQFERAVHNAADALGIKAPPVRHVSGVRARARAGIVEIDFGWLARIHAAYCRDSAACADEIVTWLATHEVAHVAGQHRWFGPGASSRGQELLADFAAGWVVARSGLGTRGIERALRHLATVCGTHPTWPSRVAAIHAGAANADHTLACALGRYNGALLVEAQFCRLPAFSG